MVLTRGLGTEELVVWVVLRVTTNQVLGHLGVQLASAYWGHSIRRVVFRGRIIGDIWDSYFLSVGVCGTNTTLGRFGDVYGKRSIAIYCHGVVVRGGDFVQPLTGVGFRGNGVIVGDHLGGFGEVVLHTWETYIDNSNRTVRGFRHPFVVKFHSNVYYGPHGGHG